MNDPWVEYDQLAKWCAKHRLTGKIGTPLPTLVSTVTHDLINADTDAFEERVKGFAYALSMEETQS